VRGLPTLVVMHKDNGGRLKVLNDNAVSDVYEDVEARRFPWRPSSIIELLGTQGFVDKDGNTHELQATLRKHEYWIFYFGGSWCGYCLQFRPQLQRFYDSAKEAKKDVEIVYISSDKDQGAFDDYLKKMDWLALPYEKCRKDLLKPLEKRFDVSGVPSVVLLNRIDGSHLELEVMTTNGRDLIGKDPKAVKFPWGGELKVSELDSTAANRINETASLVVLHPITTRRSSEDKREVISTALHAVAKRWSEIQVDLEDPDEELARNHPGMLQGFKRFMRREHDNDFDLKEDGKDTRMEERMEERNEPDVHMMDPYPASSAVRARAQASPVDVQELRRLYELASSLADLSDEVWQRFVSKHFHGGEASSSSSSSSTPAEGEVQTREALHTLMMRIKRELAPSMLAKTMEIAGDSVGGIFFKQVLALGRADEDQANESGASTLAQAAGGASGGTSAGVALAGAAAATDALFDELLQPPACANLDGLQQQAELATKELQSWIDGLSGLDFEESRYKQEQELKKAIETKKEEMKREQVSRAQVGDDTLDTRKLDMRDASEKWLWFGMGGGLVSRCAEQIGIDTKHEEQLLWIALEAFNHPVPDGWKVVDPEDPDFDDELYEEFFVGDAAAISYRNMRTGEVVPVLDMMARLKLFDSARVLYDRFRDAMDTGQGELSVSGTVDSPIVMYYYAYAKEVFEMPSIMQNKDLMHLALAAMVEPMGGSDPSSELKKEVSSMYQILREAKVEKLKKDLDAKLEAIATQTVATEDEMLPTVREGEGQAGLAKRVYKDWLVGGWVEYPLQEQDAVLEQRMQLVAVATAGAARAGRAASAFASRFVSAALQETNKTLVAMKKAGRIAQTKTIFGANQLRQLLEVKKLVDEQSRAHEAALDRIAADGQHMDASNGAARYLFNASRVRIICPSSQSMVTLAEQVNSRFKVRKLVNKFSDPNALGWAELTMLVEVDLEVDLAASGTASTSSGGGGGGGGGGGRGGGARAASALPSAIEPDPAIVLQLVTNYGFTENAAKRASISTFNLGYEDAEMWCFQHLEDPDFNDPITDPLAGGGGWGHGDDDKNNGAGTSSSSSSSSSSSQGSMHIAEISLRHRKLESVLSEVVLDNGMLSEGVKHIQSACPMSDKERLQLQQYLHQALQQGSGLKRPFPKAFASLTEDRIALYTPKAPPAADTAAAVAPEEIRGGAKRRASLTIAAAAAAAAAAKAAVPVGTLSVEGLHDLLEGDIESFLKSEDDTDFERQDGRRHLGMNEAPKALAKEWCNAIRKGEYSSSDLLRFLHVQYEGRTPSLLVPAGLRWLPLVEARAAVDATREPYEKLITNAELLITDELSREVAAGNIGLLQNYRMKVRELVGDEERHSSKLFASIPASAQDYAHAHLKRKRALRKLWYYILNTATARTLEVCASFPTSVHPDQPMACTPLGYKALVCRGEELGPFRLEKQRVEMSFVQKGHQLAATSSLPTIVLSNTRLNGGKWYYECKLHSTNHGAKRANLKLVVGVVDSRFSIGVDQNLVVTGIGDTSAVDTTGANDAKQARTSWGFNAINGVKRPGTRADPSPKLVRTGKAGGIADDARAGAADRRTTLGGRARTDMGANGLLVGDVLGVAIDVMNPKESGDASPTTFTLRFSVNGVWLAHHTFANEAYGGWLCPAITLGQGLEVHLNLGDEPMLYSPPDVDATQEKCPPAFQHGIWRSQYRCGFSEHRSCHHLGVSGISRRRLEACTRPFSPKPMAAVVAEQDAALMGPVPVNFFYSDQLPNEGQVNKWVRDRVELDPLDVLKPEVLLVTLRDGSQYYRLSDFLKWQIEKEQEKELENGEEKVEDGGAQGGSATAVKAPSKTGSLMNIGEGASTIAGASAAAGAGAGAAPSTKLPQDWWKRPAATIQRDLMAFVKAYARKHNKPAVPSHAEVLCPKLFTTRVKLQQSKLDKSQLVEQQVGKLLRSKDGLVGMGLLAAEQPQQELQFWEWKGQGPTNQQRPLQPEDRGKSLVDGGKSLVQGLVGAGAGAGSAATPTAGAGASTDVYGDEWFKADGYRDRGDGKTPEYIWNSGVFAGEFGRAFLPDCNLEGTPQVEQHFKVLIEHLERVLGWCEEQDPAKSGQPNEAQLDLAQDFNTDHVRSFERIVQLLKPSVCFERMLEKAKVMVHFPHLLDSFMDRLHKLDEDGERANKRDGDSDSPKGSSGVRLSFADTGDETKEEEEEGGHDETRSRRSSSKFFRVKGGQASAAQSAKPLGSFDGEKVSWTTEKQWFDVELMMRDRTEDEKNESRAKVEAWIERKKAAAKEQQQEQWLGWCYVGLDHYAIHMANSNSGTMNGGTTSYALCERQVCTADGQLLIRRQQRERVQISATDMILQEQREYDVGAIYHDGEAQRKVQLFLQANLAGEGWEFTGEWVSRADPTTDGTEQTSYATCKRKLSEAQVSETVGRWLHAHREGEGWRFTGDWTKEGSMYLVTCWQEMPPFRVQQSIDAASQVNLGDDPDFVVFRGGWTNRGDLPQNKIGFTMHVLERVAKDDYSLVTCNTTMDGAHSDPDDKFEGGLNYHPASSDEYPTIKARTALCLNHIPRHRIMDRAVWYTLFQNISLVKAQNCGAVLYDVVLPHLIGTMSLKRALSQNLPERGQVRPRFGSTGKELGRHRPGSDHHGGKGGDGGDGGGDGEQGGEPAEQKPIVRLTRQLSRNISERSISSTSSTSSVPSPRHAATRKYTAVKLLRQASGDNIPFDDPTQAKPPTHGGFEVVHPSRSTYATMKCCVRYLMQRIGSGMPKGVQEQILFALRIAYLQTMERDLRHCEKHGVRLQDSDKRMMRLACEQTAVDVVRQHEEVKCMSKHTLAHVKKLLTRLLGRIQTVGVADEQDRDHPPLCLAVPAAPHDAKEGEAGGDGEARSAQALALVANRSAKNSVVCFSPFANFDLVGDYTDTGALKGPKAQAANELFINMQFKPITSSASLMQAIMDCGKAVARLRAKTAIADTTLCNHQILAYIEHAFTVAIPIPNARDPLTNSLYNDHINPPGDCVLHHQRDCLRELHTIMLEYTCCAKALYSKDDVAIELLRTVTSACIMAVFDGVVRIVPSGQSISACHNPQRTEHLSEIVIEKQFRPSIVSWLATDEGGQDLKMALGLEARQRFPSGVSYAYMPQVLARRNELLSYFYDEQYFQQKPLFELKDEDDAGDIHQMTFEVRKGGWANTV
jgi:thiol-disulfide isomerase/thioredoxin